MKKADQALVITMLQEYRQGLTHREIGAKRGMTGSQVSQSIRLHQLGIWLNENAGSGEMTTEQIQAYQAYLKLEREEHNTNFHKRKLEQSYCGESPEEQYKRLIKRIERHGKTDEDCQCVYADYQKGDPLKVLAAGLGLPVNTIANMVTLGRILFFYKAYKSDVNGVVPKTYTDYLRAQRALRDRNMKIRRTKKQ